VRFTSLGGGWLDWTLGGYYEKRKDTILSQTVPADPATGYILPNIVNGATFTGTDITQLSEFAEATVHPFAGLSVTGGARHYHYDKTVRGQVLQTSFLTGSFAGPLTSSNVSTSGWVGKVNVSYKANDNILAYAQWAQGFRPGGANNIPTLSSSLVTYAPDSLNSYEVGLKTSWDRGLYTLNIAAFQVDWSGIQSSLTVVPAFRIVTNAGKARIQGLEIEGSAHPLPGLRFDGSVSYIPTAKLVEGQTGGAIVTGAQNGLAGDRMPYTAKLTTSLSGDYSWNLTGPLNAVIHGDVNYHGGSANEFRPTYVFYERLASFVEVNARVGVESEDWSAFLFVNNLTGAIGAQTVQTALGIPPYQWKRQLGSLTPRTIGVTLSKKF